MKLTSGFNFENYEITDYLGFCSGEYALNTKFLSDFNLLSSYSEKLEEAQKNALDILINNAKQMEPMQLSDLTSTIPLMIMILWA